MAAASVIPAKAGTQPRVIHAISFETLGHSPSLLRTNEFVCFLPPSTRSR